MVMVWKYFKDLNKGEKVKAWDQSEYEKSKMDTDTGPVLIWSLLQGTQIR